MKRSCSTFVLFLILINAVFVLPGAAALSVENRDPATSGSRFFNMPSSPDSGVMLHFESLDSAIKVESGARFNNSSSNLTVDGTLKFEDGVDVSGSEINFDKGVLHSAGLEAEMVGVYDPTGDDSVRLEGSGRFTAEPGTLIKSLIVEGTNNRLEGQPMFSDPIVLTDGATELTVGIQSKLNQNIEMNEGTLLLSDDLALADGVILDGDGRVELNNRTLQLGSVYSGSWYNSLYFNNAVDVVLNGKVSLTGTWTFGGVSCLNGNGVVLDLSGGGQIIVDNDALLYMDDIHVTGLGDGLGQIIMRNHASQVRSSNCTFKLDNDFTTSQGSLYVHGPSTFALAHHDWTFDVNGTLTVDGVTLWLDFLDSPIYPGYVNAPLPLYDGMEWNGPNLAFNLASGHLSLINRGTIKMSVDASVVGFPSTELLLSGSVTGTVLLNRCVCLGPNDFIRVVGDAVIDGRGSIIKFTDPDNPQLVVKPGVHLILRDVTFQNINYNSFDLRDGSHIWIGDNVTWELDEDITVSQGTMRVMNGSMGSNVFKVRGETCRRGFNIWPLVPILPNGQPRKSFELGHNTLMLENAYVSGIEHISYDLTSWIAPAIALSCNAGADIDVDTDINFFIEGLNNDLIMRLDGLNLGGNISFGDYPDNQLNVRFMIAEPFSDQTPNRRPGVRRGFPFVILSGDPGIYLYSFGGLAHLNFPDLNACVRNFNSNAFIVDANSLLTFNNLQILDNPIKQMSPLFRFEGFHLFNEKIDPGFIRLPSGIRSPSFVCLNALHLQRQQEREEYALAQQYALDEANIHVEPSKPLNPLYSDDKPEQTVQDKVDKPSKPKPKPRPRPRPGKPRPRPGKRDLSEYLEEFEVLGLDKDEVAEFFVSEGQEALEEKLEALKLLVGSRVTTRALNLPDGDPDQTYTDQVWVPDDVITSYLRFLRSTVKNFRTDPNQAFNILLDDGSTIWQGAEDIVLADDQYINVRGKGNVINVTQSMTIKNGNLLFEEGCELTFNFVNDGSTEPTVYFADDTALDLEKHTILRFTGSGTVVFGDDNVVNFKGEKTVSGTGVEDVTARPRFIVTEQATMKCAQAAQVRMQGIGRFEVFKHGHLNFGQAGTLIFGLDQSTVGGDPVGTLSENAQDFEFIVSDNGRVTLDPTSIPLGSPGGVLSFRHGAFKIKFGNDGKLFVGNHGVLQINSAGFTNIPNGLTHMPGVVRELSLSQDGSVSFHNGGKIVIGPNKINSGTGKEYVLNYDGLSASIAGDGVVYFVDTRKANFSANLNTNTPVFTRNNSYSFFEFARDLVQQNSSLTVSILFIRPDGTRQIMTKDGVVVDLLDTDYIRSDNPNTGVISCDNTATGVDFVINPDGSRS